MILSKLVKREGPARYTPWSGDLQRLFEELWNDRLEGVPSSLGNVWSPAVDIEETDEAYVLRAEIPGLRKEDVKVSLADNVLTVSGEKKIEEKHEGRKYHRVERSYGAFQRSFTLGVPVQGNKIKAAFKDGVLEVTLPKSEEAKPREIDIQVG